MTNDSIKTMDPIMLLSIINMKLRDQYSSLDILCYDMGISNENIISRLDIIGYSYNEKENQFK
ncbi:DUF4250 domain-containing protein [Clostridium sp. C2-6-12]|uniref:DUF4250 domain-containing protein n=1 Tax=Clostridium sp. C2-6-12 TaxID=2698832 RepID=UPI001367AD0F|nr:DUF4250 domain-containing protein [Clostridium sp. C2-6-12]